MDETAVYFDMHYNYSVDRRGAKTESVRRGSSDCKLCTVCVTIAADGIKLPLLLIFKGAGNGRIANSLDQIMPNSMYGCIQEKGFMDN